MKEISGIDELDEFIISNTDNDMCVLLYFGAKWCGPCNQLKQRLDHIDTTKSMPKLAVAYMDIDNDSNDKLVKRYKVNSLPTQIFIKLNNNKIVEQNRIEGYDYTKLQLEYKSCCVKIEN
jgi:thiol-disulfide isomerase/thioredoxin